MVVHKDQSGCVMDQRWLQDFPRVYRQPIHSSSGYLLVVHDMPGIVEIERVEAFSRSRAKVQPDKGEDIFRAGYRLAVLDCIFRGSCQACLNEAEIGGGLGADALDVEQAVGGLLENIEEGPELL